MPAAGTAPPDPSWPGASGANVRPHLPAQREPLRHPKTVLLVDDRQRQVPEPHLILDHRVGAHHQRRLAGLDQFQHRLALFLLLAASQPRHPDVQRLQPADQLSEMLLGQDLCGRHQRALPARVDRNGGGERGHHGLARAHIALQQPVHGHGARQVARDFLAHAALCAGETERQRRQQLLVQGQGQGGSGRCSSRSRRERRRPQVRPLAPGHELRQLLRQQFLGLQALPGRVAAVFELRHRDIGRRMMQERQRIAKTPRRGDVISASRTGRKRLREVRPRHPARHRPAQVGLRQPGPRGVNRRQRRRQLAARGMKAGVHHRQAHETTAHLAPRTDAVAHRQRLLLRRVEAEKAQHAGVRTIVHRHQQLPARAHRHLAGRDRASICTMSPSRASRNRTMRVSSS